MARDRQRLRRLVDLRRRQERQARSQLAQSLQKVAEISEEVRVRTEAFERVLEGDTNPRQRTHLATLMEFVEPTIQAARAAEASAMGAAAEVRREWQRTAMRLKGMERLEERRLAELEEIVRAAEAVDFDDAATARGHVE